MRKIFFLFAMFMAVCLNMQAERTTLWESDEPVKIAWGSSVGAQASGVAADWGVGDKLIVTCTGKTDEDDYPQVMFKDAGWADINPSVQLNNVSEFPYEAVFTLTEAMVESMQNGFHISGTAVYVNKLEYEKSQSNIDTSNAIWLGENTYPDSNWWSGTSPITIGANVFADAQAGDVLEFRASEASDAFLVQPFIGGWDGTKRNSNDDADLFTIDGNTISYTLTADDVTALKAGGLVIQAGGCTLNVVALVPALNRLDLDLTNNMGWGYEFDASTQTITYSYAWAMCGVGSWGSTTDYSTFDYAVVEFAEPSGVGGNLAVWGSGDNYAGDSFEKYCVRKVFALPDFKDAIARVGIQSKVAGSAQVSAFYLCTEAYKTENSLKDAYEMPERYDLDMSDLSSGWDSTYDPDTKTITIEAGWSGRGWWYGGADYGKYQYLVVRFAEKTPDQGNIMIESKTDGVDDITGHFDWRCVQRVIDISTCSDNLLQVYFQAPKGTVLRLDEAYFCTEDYKTRNALEDIYEPFFTLAESDETIDWSATDGKTVIDIVLDREVVPEIWNTFCLPYPVLEPQAIGAEQIMLLSDYDAAANALRFTAATEVPAGVPFLMKPALNDYSNWIIWNVAVAEMVQAPVAQRDVFFGTFTKRTLEEGDYFISKSTNKLTKGNAGTDMRGLRGYFHLGNGQSAPTMVFDNEATGISQLVNSGEIMAPATVYSLSGQVVGTTESRLQRGVYVVNGKKFVVK